MTYIQNPPYTVKVELSEGCNLACTFCGINGIREKPGKVFNFMSVATAESIARQLAQLVQLDGWNPHLEFTMHGEPTMNPEHVRIIAAFRAALPRTQLMMTSNGGGLLRGDTAANIRHLMDAGLNVLALDDYEGVNIVGKIRERTAEDVMLGTTYTWMEHPADPDSSPHKRRSVKEHRVIAITDIRRNEERKEGLHAHISNHCGAAAPRDMSYNGKRCARPFRELAIRWDGNVGACCDDWRGEYKIGNVLKEGIGSLWQNDRFMALRKKLYHGQRDFGACRGCSSRSFRVGLLPDPMGKLTMPLPEVYDQRIIKAATAGAPLATVIFRQWEKEDGSR